MNDQSVNFFFTDLLADAGVIPRSRITPLSVRAIFHRMLVGPASNYGDPNCSRCGEPLYWEVAVWVEDRSQIVVNLGDTTAISADVTCLRCNYCAPRHRGRPGRSHVRGRFNLAIEWGGYYDEAP